MTLRPLASCQGSESSPSKSSSLMRFSPPSPSVMEFVLLRVVLRPLFLPAARAKRRLALKTRPGGVIIRLLGPRKTGGAGEDSGSDRRWCGPWHERRRARRGAGGFWPGLGSGGDRRWLRGYPGGAPPPLGQAPARGAHAPGRDGARHGPLQGGQGGRRPGARGPQARRGRRGGAWGHRREGEAQQRESAGGGGGGERV